METYSNTKTSQLKRAAIYARFSSDMQREESIEAQLCASHEYAERNNMIVVEEYIDRAKSATTDRRPEFQRMIKDAEQKNFDSIIVHKFDRFSRDKYDFAIYKRKLRESNVVLRSVLEPLDDSPESVILESVLEGMAEYYSRNLAREVRKGLMENAKKATHTGGVAPFGFCVNKETKKLELNEIEAIGVKLIFDMVLQGYSYHSIIRELNDRGYKTRGNRPFGTNSLYSLLRNEKYRGCYTYNKSAAKDINGKRNGHKYKSNDEIIRVEGGCPRIVSDEDFFRVQEMMNTRKQPENHPNSKEQYLLTGKIYCGICQSAYTGSRRKRGNHSYWVYYTCNRRNRYKGEACKNMEISRDYIESKVLRHIATTVFSTKMVDEITRAYNEYLKSNKDSGGELARLKWRHSKIVGDLDQLTEMLLQTKSDTLLKKLEKMEDERRDLETRIYQAELLKPKTEITKGEIANVFKIIQKKLMNGDLESIKQLIAVYVDRIDVYPNEVIIRFNYLPTIKISSTSMEPNNEGKQKTKKQQTADFRIEKNCKGFDASLEANRIGDQNKNSSQYYVSHFGGERGI